MPKKQTAVENIEEENNAQYTNNPLLTALRENDKKNLFSTNVSSAFIKTGFHLFDYYFGAVVNIHDKLGKIIRQEARIGQAAGTFNLIIGNTASGKAQPISEDIPTPAGWKKMGDIKPGDYVFGSDGKPVEVLGIYPQGVRDVYEITMYGGVDESRTVRCTMDHLWTIGVLDPGLDICFYTEQLKDIMEHSYDHIYFPAFARHGKIGDPDYIRNKGDKIILLCLKDIQYVGEEECQCILVDSPDHLYATDQFVLTHNTTLAMQFSANIIRQFPYANVMHFDCENRTDISRIENVTKLPAYYFNDGHGGERYMLRSGPVGLDMIQEMIVKTYVAKKKLKDTLMVDSGHLDEFNNPVMMYQPTIVIIDSITTVLNETFNPDSTKEASDAEKMRGNTEGARDAKTLKGFFKDVLPLCKETNIIIYGINHINTNMSMNAFIPVARQQNYLKQEESIPGGKTMLYYPFNIIKLTAKPSDDFTEEADGFEGHLVMVEPIKSSSNQSGNNSKGISFNLVFTFKEGFDSLRSIILYARERGLIEGNKTRMKFKDDDSFTFNFKELEKEKLEKPIWDDIKKYVIPTLSEHLPFLEPEEFDDRILDY